MEAGTNEEIKAEVSLSIVTFEGRKLPANYHNVIIARWIRSYKMLQPFFEHTEPASFFANYELIVKCLMARPNSKVRILVTTDNIDEVYGWCVYEKSVLHYVHIQEPYRNKRRSYDLIPAGIDTISHTTKHWLKKMKKFKHLKLDQFK